jgi:hypothetical protein
MIIKRSLGESRGFIYTFNYLFHCILKNIDDFDRKHADFDKIGGIIIR